MKFTFSPESRPLSGYTIKRAIYRGGFGEVYYAVSDAGRDVALKLLQNNAEVELRGVQQCLNLSHPNLVTIFDVRRDEDNDHWIIMEYVPGETLDTTIRRFPSGMPMEDVRRWLHGIAGGVDFLHQRGIVHRDLKPGNIFAAPSGAKVGDVGLSKFISASQRSAQTQSVGTVYYMAPEVAQGRYGKEIDVYALGVILFEMVTGQVPFDGESTGEILMKHLSQPPDLRRLPERLRPVIARALAKDPQQRFASVTAFQRAFDDAVVGRGTSQAHATGSVSSSTEEPRRHKFGCGPKRCRPEGWTRRTPPQPWGAGSCDGWSIGRGLAIAAFVVVLVSLSRGSFGRGPILISVIAALYGMGYGAYALCGLVSRESRRFLDRSLSGVPQAAPLRTAIGPAGPRRVAPPTARERWLAWTSTASMAPVVVAALAALLGWLQPSFYRTSFGSPDLGALGLFAGTAVAAVWLLGGVAVFQEGRGYEPMARRVGFALAGAGVGLVAHVLDDWLIGTGALSSVSRGMRALGERPLIESSGNPGGLAYLLYFASLALAVRWGKQTSAIRASRFQVAPLVWSTMIAYGLTFVWPVPQEWGVLWGAVVSAGLQISSPWTRTDDLRTVA